MQRHLKTFALVAATLGLGVAPVLSADFDPRGLWQTTTGESRYAFDYCGDGTRLCATLVWLNKDAMQSPARKQLGTYAVDYAVKAGANLWKGPLHYNGMTADTTLTFRSARDMSIAGCYFVWCKSFELVKIKAR